MAEQHIAVLLAAGGSQRLGHSKLWLRQNGESLLHKAARLALATAPHELLVITGAEHTRTVTELAGLPLRCLHNRHWQSGLASSLQTAAEALQHHQPQHHQRRVLILACDQLHLSAAHLEVLLAQHAQWPEHNIASAYAGTIGLPAVVTAQTLQASQQLEGDRGLKTLLLADPTHLQTVTAEPLAFDLDTPEDEARAIALGWLDSCSAK